MTGMARKLLICAAVDGVVLHPLGPRNGADNKSVKIAYGTNVISPATRVDKNGSSIADAAEAYGIVGLLDLLSSSYLIAIVRRDQVAQIRGKAVYAITDVVLIPLSSQVEAQRAISSTQKSLGGQGDKIVEESEESDVGDEEDTASVGEVESDLTPDLTASEPPKSTALNKSSTFLKNVLQDQGRYGRFADRWFSKSGWNANGRRRQGMSSKDDLTIDQSSDISSGHEKAGIGVPESETRSSERNDGRVELAAKAGPRKESLTRQREIERLTPRILRTARLYFSSSGFFFSYEHDLSATFQRRDTLMSSVPLWKRFDPVFFWNHHLMKPFIEAGQESLVLPLLQGFVGQRAFSVERTEGTKIDIVAEAVDKPEVVLTTPRKAESVEPTDGKAMQEDFLLTLISRRGINRAGLRYLRRGIDDAGNVANYVETEQVLSSQDWDMAKKTFSLIQIRGSIPLFFSQSPYSFKPVPTMFGSEATNKAAFKKHFEKISRRYGSIQVASLVDKHGTEVSIGQAYENHVNSLNEGGGINGKPIAFEWFDFHKVCKGMRFDKVSLLLDALQGSLRLFGWGVRENERNIRQQTGVLRTNCMDCLDRTNVVQSAVGGWVLQQQLAEMGMSIDLQTDAKTQWFNTLWADNGDAISRQYAGTAALKGDFTRTRKRNWTGALSDFSLTLNRYYNNIFGDYFLQLNIDYFLGKVGPAAFDEFEDDMMGQDYALDVQRIRQNAIDTCIKIVLEDPKEDLAAGWTLSCPHEANTLRSLPFEECVLLLTDVALYFCRFDWDAEKVGSFERVDLLDVTEIWRGAYITSTHGPTHTDVSRNVGFALRYNTSGHAVVRRNTRALSNEQDAADENSSNSELEKQRAPEKHERRLLAFKALPPNSSAMKDKDEGGGETAGQVSEVELVQHICDMIHELMTASARAQREADGVEETASVPQVEERDVVSVAQAMKSTGYMESIGYSLKKLVWS